MRATVHDIAQDVLGKIVEGLQSNEAYGARYVDLAARVYHEVALDLKMLAADLKKHEGDPSYFKTALEKLRGPSR